MQHTCHDMNPPFPYECAACAEERIEAALERGVKHLPLELGGPAGGALGEADACERDAGSPQSTGASDHPPIYPDEHGDWVAANRGSDTRALRRLAQLIGSKELLYRENEGDYTAPFTASDRKRLARLLHKLAGALPT